MQKMKSTQMITALQPNPTIDAEKSPENSNEKQLPTPEDVLEVQKEKLPSNTRGEKHNLRPNPNPNSSIRIPDSGQSNIF